MKKKLLYSLIGLFLLCLISTPVQGKHLNFFSTAGSNLSDFKGPVLNFGFEAQVYGGFYAQLMFDFYPEPIDELSDFVDYSANSFSLYISYKIPASHRIDFFVNAGTHYTTMRVKTDINTGEISADESDFGIGAGAGFEYLLNRRFGILFGATYHILFAQDNYKWLKIYGGISFAVQ